MRPLNPKFRLNSSKHFFADILPAMYSQNLNIFSEREYKAKGIFRSNSTQSWLNNLGFVIYRTSLFLRLLREERGVIILTSTT